MSKIIQFEQWKTIYFSGLALGQDRFEKHGNVFLLCDISLEGLDADVSKSVLLRLRVGCSHCDYNDTFNFILESNTILFDRQNSGVLTNLMLIKDQYTKGRLVLGMTESLYNLSNLSRYFNTDGFDSIKIVKDPNLLFKRLKAGRM